MAKTLIGNIKGKNGRGITSIKKTGTTGPVDTYTITYTDSTTSTFTVNNSDNIALQRQIVPSAAVESSATASQAYAAGDYVVVNGALRKVKSAIAKGNTISDSNSTTTTVAGELATLGDSVSQVPRIRKFSTSIVRASSNWDSNGRLLAITKDEYKELVGRDFNGFDVVQAFNGDNTVNSFDVTNLSYWGSGNFWVDVSGGRSEYTAKINIKIIAIDFE